MPKEKTKEPAKREGLSINTVITVLGSITVALITSYFGYLGIIRKAETPTPTVAIETATPTTVPADTQDLLSITRDSTCYSNYIPNSLFEGQNKSDWLAKNYFPLYEEEELVYAPRMFDGNTDNPVYISYSVSNAGTEPAWVRIEKEIALTVKYLQAPDPQPVDITMPEGCGEGGDEALHEDGLIDLSIHGAEAIDGDIGIEARHFAPDDGGELLRLDSSADVKI